jgi:hypothetical protein
VRSKVRLLLSRGKTPRNGTKITTDPTAERTTK